jgi:hypothetical protein
LNFPLPEIDQAGGQVGTHQLQLRVYYKNINRNVYSPLPTFQLTVHQITNKVLAISSVGDVTESGPPLTTGTVINAINSGQQVEPQTTGEDTDVGAGLRYNGGGFLKKMKLGKVFKAIAKDPMVRGFARGMAQRGLGAVGLGPQQQGAGYTGGKVNWNYSGAGLMPRAELEVNAAAGAGLSGQRNNDVQDGPAPDDSFMNEIYE